jgi:hypothetical protein
MRNGNCRILDIIKNKSKRCPTKISKSFILMILAKSTNIASFSRSITSLFQLPEALLMMRLKK